MSKEMAPTLEENFSKLEEIIAKMEQPEVTLDESFALYQSGMETLKNCNSLLDAVEKKMQILTADGETEEF